MRKTTAGTKARNTANKQNRTAAPAAVIRVKATLVQPESFVALDFETADYERDSACSVALVRVEGRRIVRRQHFLIRPPRQTFVFT